LSGHGKKRTATTQRNDAYEASRWIPEWRKKEAKIGKTRELAAEVEKLVQMRIRPAAKLGGGSAVERS